MLFMHVETNGVCTQDDSHNLLLSDEGLYLTESPTTRRIVEKNMALMLEISATSRHFFLRADTRYGSSCLTRD